ncbi:protein NDRG3-like isoform X2 [Ornithodoros turicata]|uniref:protein NDRG3-like isoform X2 n=1 Tax=Ornithodoros turicata TaxID=34597 RepID=UPI0031397092
MDAPLLKLAKREVPYSKMVPVQKDSDRSEFVETKDESGMPTDTMDDIELRNVELQYPLMRSLARSDSYTQEDRIDTDFGSMVVAVQGDKNKPAMFTYHDIGLNHVSNFQAFFNYTDVRDMMKNFCIYHINAPGQEEGAAPLPDGYAYPSMETLADMLLLVMKFYKIKHFIGFGVGAGAYILAKFALDRPELVDGLFLINCTATKSSWVEWGYQKLNAMHLRSSGMTASTIDYLMWHHFGKDAEERNHDLVMVFRQYFNKTINAHNLGFFIDSFIRRSDLNVTRETDPIKKKMVKNFKCSVMLVAGALSPHLEDTVNMNSRLDPATCSWMKVSDCGMVLEEQPGKVSESFRLYLQGLGYALNSSQRRTSAASLNEALEMRRRSSLTAQHAAIQKLNVVRQSSLEEETNTASKQEVHIVENPINQHQVNC